MKTRQRGSAYIYVLLMILAITIVGMAASDASMSFILTQKRIEKRMKADIILAGGVEYFDALRVQTRPDLPHTSTVVIDGTSCQISAVDMPSSPGLVKVTATCSYGGYSYNKTTYLAKDRFSPFQYAFAAGKNFSNNKLVITGLLGLLGATGNIYAGDKANLSNILNQINGDVDCPDPDVKGIISGKVYKKAGEILFPNPSVIDYGSSATTVLTGDQTINGYVFPAVAANASYPLVCIAGNLNIRGSISGIGTIYATGNITINGAMSYANSASRIALISDNNVVISGAFDCVGYLYAEKDLTVNGLLLGSVTRGGVMAKNNIVLNRNLTVNHDPAVTTDANEGVRMRLPAYWP